MNIFILVFSYVVWLFIGSILLYLVDKREYVYMRYFAYMNPILRIMIVTVWPIVFAFTLYTRWRVNDNI